MFSIGTFVLGDDDGDVELEKKRVVRNETNVRERMKK
jgi:hypothetical protein